MKDLKSGIMVRLMQTKLDGVITGRKQPRGGGLFSQREANIAVHNIPNGSQALYMSTMEDGFNSALRAKGAGPYGYTPSRVFYHFVLWEGRPIWVSSAECTLEKCE